jgi:hypothetical protein
MGRSARLPLVLGLGLLAASVSASRAGDSSPGAPVLQGMARLAGKVLDTSVVGFDLRGQSQYEKISVPDLGILLQDSGARLVPMLQILGIFGLARQDSAGVLVFRVEGGPRVLIDYTSGDISIGGSAARKTSLTVGYSDLTNQLELYISDELLPEVLAADGGWNERTYGYVYRVTRKLAVFDRRMEQQGGAVGPITSRRVVDPLPDHLPPADIRRLDPPAIDFAELSLQSDAARTGARPGIAGTISSPTLHVWSHLAGGNLRASATSGSAPGSSRGLSLEGLIWQTQFGDNEVAAGDNSIGLSELIFPSLSIRGVRANGLIGRGIPQDSDPSRLGQEASFSPVQDIEGTAPAQATVTLYVNGRVVTSQTVSHTTEAPPGRGIYRFAGTNLLANQSNVVRVVAVSPDSSIEETRNEVFASSLLAPAGTMAYLTGAGRRLAPIASRVVLDGEFQGGRIMYGVLPSLSLAFVAARQSRMFLFPRESTHLGLRLLWRPLGPVLVGGDLARSDDPAGDWRDAASAATLEWHRGDARLRSEVFRYGPHYFGGSNSAIHDRAGLRAACTMRLGPRGRLAIAALRANDNLDHRLPKTGILTMIRTDATLATPVPRTRLRLGSSTERGPTRKEDRRALSIGLESSLFRRSRFDATVQGGSGAGGHRRNHFLGGQDPLVGIASGDLGYGQPLASSLRLARSLGRSWDAAVERRTTNNIRRTFLDLSWSPVSWVSPRLRWAAGYDDQDGTWFGQWKSTISLDRGHRSTLEADASVSESGWSAHVGVQLNYLLGFSGSRPFPITGGRIDPSAGGIKGRVFIDTNANGVPDAGEPGLPQIEVMDDAGNRTAAGTDGRFVLPGGWNRNQARVSLNSSTLPATYTPTQGTQMARLRPGLFTEVNLGVGVFGTITGSVRDSSMQSSGRSTVAGIRILLVAADATVAGTSITDKSGGFYLGEVRPGRYTLAIDRQTLPPGLRVDMTSREIQMPGSVESIEIGGVAFGGRSDPAPPSNNR